MQVQRRGNRAGDVGDQDRDVALQIGSRAAAGRVRARPRPVRRPWPGRACDASGPCGVVDAKHQQARAARAGSRAGRDRGRAARRASRSRQIVGMSGGVPVPDRAAAPARHRRASHGLAVELFEARRRDGVERPVRGSNRSSTLASPAGRPGAPGRAAAEADRPSAPGTRPPPSASRHSGIACDALTDQA